MKYARIVEDKVVELIDFDPAGKFHSDLKWLAVPADLENEVDTNFVVVNGTISVPSTDYLREKEMSPIRDMRNEALKDSDWTQMNDAPLDDAAKAAWRTYRQALRDLPANTTNPAEPDWPEMPAL